MSVDTGRSALAANTVAMSIIRLRFTILFLTVMLIASLLAEIPDRDLPGEILRDWGIGHDSLLSGQIFRLITGIFLSHDFDMFIRQFIFAAAVIGYTEWTRGTVRAALLFFGLDIAGTLLLLACVRWGAGLIDMTAMNDVGMSIGGFGLIGVTIASWRGKWPLMTAILVAIAVKFTIAPDLLADTGHVLALSLGFALGGLLPSLERATPEESDHAQ